VKVVGEVVSSSDGGCKEAVGDLWVKEAAEASDGR